MGLAPEIKGLRFNPRLAPQRTEEVVHNPSLEPRENDGQKTESPIHPGWLVAYRDRDGRLRGGCDDREHGTVKEGLRSNLGWVFTLTDGSTLTGKQILSVAEVGKDSQVLRAWLVHRHGLDGIRRVFP